MLHIVKMPRFVGDFIGASGPGTTLLLNFFTNVKLLGGTLTYLKLYSNGCI